MISPFLWREHNRSESLLKWFHIWRIQKAQGSRSWWFFKATHWVHCQWKRQSKHLEQALCARDLCHGAKQSYSYSHPTASHPLSQAESVLVTRVLQLVPQPGIPGAKHSQSPDNDAKGIAGNALKKKSIKTTTGFQNGNQLPLIDFRLLEVKPKRLPSLLLNKAKQKDAVKNMFLVVQISIGVKSLLLEKISVWEQNLYSTSVHCKLS